VGYWQFKDFTAIEMGLRVDRDVDERMNIVSATRAAARYIKKNNTFFNNWLFALQAYQMGAGGVLRSEKDSKSGQKQMDITSGTYWYVKKFLAHKIAYEGFTKGTPEISVVPYESITSRRTLAEIATEVNIDEEQIRLYNKWLKTNKIPEDRTYSVIIPVKGDPSGIKLPETAVASTTTVGLHEKSTKAGTVKTTQARIRVNGIAAIRAGELETPAKLAQKAGVDLSAFLKWNDISISDRIQSGEYYLLGKKRARATQPYHKVLPGETLWSVSQRYAVQMKKLRKYNRLSSDEIKPGMTLWLSTQKPRDEAGSPSMESPVEVSEGDTFAWDITPAESASASPTTKITIEPEVVVVTDTSKAFPADSLRTMPEVSSVEVTESTDSARTLPVTQTQVVTIPSDSIPGTLTNPVAQNPDMHVVQPKETLYGIARQYQLGVMDLVNWNNLDLQQGIKPGQVIKLTPPEEMAKKTDDAPAMNLVHEVKPTDTVYSIARKYGVTIKELLEWNDKRDFNLSVGEKLKIIKK
jgi:membrane-bound lytic murein transglycosylase D